MTRPAGKCVAVILAAGESRRMGVPKALLEFRAGQTFLSRLSDVLEAADCEVLSVVGKDATVIRRAHPDAALIENKRWMDGQLSSARVGIKAALDAGAALVLIHPVDSVNIRPDTVEALLSELASSTSPDRADAVVPAHEGMPGHPLLLSRSAAEKVLQTDAPHLEAAIAKLRVLRIEVSDPAVALNLNTPEDYRRAFGQKPRTARRRAHAKSKRG